MDSQPWWQQQRQGERFDPDDDDNDGYGPPADVATDTMSFQVFTNRLPYQESDLPASRATTTRTAPTQGAGNGAGESGSTDGGGENAAATTFTTPVRLSDTTVALSTPSKTSAFVTPTRVSSEDGDGNEQSIAQVTGSSASVDSTLRTATSSRMSDSTIGASSASFATDNPSSNSDGTALPDVAVAHKHGISNGEIAAAVIMPILAAVAIFAALLFCRRRRRRRSPPPQPFFPAMMEKVGHFRNRASSPSTISDPSTPPPAPVVTNASNNAYYTGLDTSSHGSRGSNSQEGYYAPRRSEGGTFADPPPPYHDGKPPQLPALGTSTLVVPQGREPALPEPAMRTQSPFEDPISPLQEHEQTRNVDGVLLSPIDRPAPSRSNTSVSRAPSISSTQYSDSASVHSARAARMSVGLGGPQMIMSSSPPTSRVQTRQASVAGQSEGVTSTPAAQGDNRRSVFDDPASPVSSVGSVEGLEYWSLPASSRRGSAVSGIDGGTGMR